MSTPYIISSDQCCTRQFEVRSYEVDFKCLMRVTSLFNHLQDIAWEHAEQLGFGWHQLRERSVFWVLSRIEVKFVRLPRWTERVELCTWPRPADGIFALRDFVMTDGSGNRLLSATSCWLVLDVASRRPQRMAQWYTGRDFSTVSVTDHLAPKIPDCDTQPFVTEQLIVKQGDIDMNGHVNNVRYIDWACNTFDVQHFAGNYPLRLCVNFNGEARFGETVEIQRFSTMPGADLLQVSRPGDGKNLCKLDFRWRPTEQADK